MSNYSCYALSLILQLFLKPQSSCFVLIIMTLKGLWDFSVLLCSSDFDKFHISMSQGVPP